MSNRCLLHRSKISAFIQWLGPKALPPVGKWEVVRWKGGPKQPMRIVFDNVQSSQHFSCNNAAEQDVRNFINQLKG
jgi:hypothetical protein